MKMKSTPKTLIPASSIIWVVILLLTSSLVSAAATPRRLLLLEEIVEVASKALPQVKNRWNKLPELEKNIADKATEEGIKKGIEAALTPNNNNNNNNTNTNNNRPAFGDNYNKPARTVVHRPRN